MSDGARYRRLYAFEWHDSAFRALDDSARVVMLYVRAGPQTTSVGCFRLSTALAVEDLGGTAEDFERRLEAACDAFCWAWDPVARVIWMRDWFDKNPPANPNVVNSWAKLLRNVPDSDVKIEAIADINRSLKELPASFRAPWAELSKLFSRTESKAQSRTETIQGAVNGEFRTESREQAPRGGKMAAIKNPNGAGRTNGASDPRRTQVEALARKTLKSYPEMDTDLLTDHLQHFATNDGLKDVSRTEALAALTVVLAERRHHESTH